MGSTLVAQGLERFAAGDTAEAARLWLLAKSQGETSPQVEAYLKHVQATDPDGYADAVAQVDAGSGVSSSSAAAAPLAPTPIDGGPDGWDETGATPSVPVQSEAAGLSILEIPSPGVLAPAPQPDASEDTSAPSKTDLEARLREQRGLDDFSGALETAEELLRCAPEHTEAVEARAECRAQLQTMYASKLGDVNAVPKVLKTPEELIWLDLDHRSGFVLAQIDGASSFEEIVQVCGMEPFESYRILAKLMQDGVIAAEEPV